MKRGMGRIKHIHFVGIGGAGMAPIAEILRREGYEISGSDLSDNSLTQRLAKIGAKIYQGHAAENIDGADVVVYSSAVREDNPEYRAAKQKGIPLLQRAQMLAELMRFREGIAIAGTHGKTTTTSLMTSILTQAGLDPTYVIGGRLNSSGAHANMGSGPHIVVEADESDASFLYLKSTMAIVTNIDADHMATYDNDFSKLKQAFIDFLHHLPFYGTVALCIDDPVITEIYPLVQRPKIRYGFSDAADVQATQFRQVGMHCFFTVVDKIHQDRFDIELSMPGRHNVQNALATIVIARECGVSPAEIALALKQFTGVGRRLQCYGHYSFSENKSATLYDDYGHHPKEIAVTVEALKNAFPQQRLLMVFQPHRYSRTHDLFNDFVDVLSEMDNLILLPIYPASEQPIQGITSEALAQAITKKTQRVPLCVTLEDLNQTLQQQVNDHDILLMQGAGNIGACAMNLSESLQRINLV